MHYPPADHRPAIGAPDVLNDLHPDQNSMKFAREIEIATYLCPDIPQDIK
jgi:hypothetical protein